MAAEDMTEIARSGYDGNAGRYLYTSPHYYAHALGAYMRTSGRTVPCDVRMGRGDSIRANDMRFSIKHAAKGAPRGVTFERVE
jgi:hypothetical protein